jgi:hypothetical protein
MAAARTRTAEASAYTIVLVIARWPSASLAVSRGSVPELDERGPQQLHVERTLECDRRF